MDIPGGHSGHPSRCLCNLIMNITDYSDINVKTYQF